MDCVSKEKGRKLRKVGMVRITNPLHHRSYVWGKECQAEGFHSKATSPQTSQAADATAYFGAGVRCKGEEAWQLN